MRGQNRENQVLQQIEGGEGEVGNWEECESVVLDCGNNARRQNGERYENMQCLRQHEQSNITNRWQSQQQKRFSLHNPIRPKTKINHNCKLPITHRHVVNKKTCD